MTSIDLPDANYTVSILSLDRKYLLYQFEGQLYKHTCLPSGLTSASRIFTKLSKPVLSALWKQGHQITGYLDDAFLTGNIFNKCRETILSSVKLSSKLGLQIHSENSQLVPSQETKVLRLIINLRKMTICLS